MTIFTLINVNDDSLIHFDRSIIFASHLKSLFHHVLLHARFFSLSAHLFTDSTCTCYEYITIGIYGTSARFVQTFLRQSILLQREQKYVENGDIRRISRYLTKVVYPCNNVNFYWHNAKTCGHRSSITINSPRLFVFRKSREPFDAVTEALVYFLF